MLVIVKRAAGNAHTCESEDIDYRKGYARRTCYSGVQCACSGQCAVYSVWRYCERGGRIPGLVRIRPITWCVFVDCGRPSKERRTDSYTKRRLRLRRCNHGITASAGADAARNCIPMRNGDGYHRPATAPRSTRFTGSMRTPAFMLLAALTARRARCDPSSPHKEHRYPSGTLCC
jgi:hypothetical protein